MAGKGGQKSCLRGKRNTILYFNEIPPAYTVERKGGLGPALKACREMNGVKIYVPTFILQSTNLLDI